MYDLAMTVVSDALKGSNLSAYESMIAMFFAYMTVGFIRSYEVKLSFIAQKNDWEFQIGLRRRESGNHE
jgi:hypothetical protein